MSAAKGKQSQTLVKVTRTDFNQKHTVAVGTRVQHERNSTSIFTEVTGHLNGNVRGREGRRMAWSRVREVKNGRKREGDIVS